MKLVLPVLLAAQLGVAIWCAVLTYKIDLLEATRAPVVSCGVLAEVGR